MLAAVPDSDDPPPRQFKFKPKEFERVNAPRGEDVKSDDHDVYAIRRQIREREQAAGLDDHAPPPPKKSRRPRDFWLSLALGWGALMAVGGLTSGLFGLLAGAVLGVLYAFGLWWIIFHVLDDY
jgi:hypothetical protein